MSKGAWALFGYVIGLTIGFWLSASDCRAQSIGVNLVTAHTTPGYRVWTPGIYASNGPWSAGVLRNSEGSWGAHATHAWRAGDVLGQPVQVSAGLITGYRRAPVLPFAAVSMPIALGRVIAIPGPRCVAIHYAYEFR